ncbi:hypothetical protein D3C77_590420 [compost metagenome]
MALAVQRQRCQQFATRIAQQPMLRAPAGTGTDAAALLQRREEGMAHERLRRGQQGVPAGGVEVGESGKGLDRHAGQSGPSRRRKKAPPGAGLKGSITDEVMF